MVLVSLSPLPVNEISGIGRRLRLKAEVVYGLVSLVWLNGTTFSTSASSLKLRARFLSLNLGIIAPDLSITMRSTHG